MEEITYMVAVVDDGKKKIHLIYHSYYGFGWIMTEEYITPLLYTTSADIAVKTQKALNKK